VREREKRRGRKRERERDTERRNQNAEMLAQAVINYHDNLHLLCRAYWVAISPGLMALPGTHDRSSLIPLHLLSNTSTLTL
jgi:hypothetical protein